MAIPRARVLLCKRVVVDAGYIVFFTNYQSRKGRELAARPRAAAVFHWDALHRQVRIEGPIVRSPGSESDEYFASRALDSRIAAWASEQSEPLRLARGARQSVREVADRFGIAPGATSGRCRGRRTGAAIVCGWKRSSCGQGANRVHDRAVWTRQLQPAGEDAFTGGPWRSTRLNP